MGDCMAPDFRQWFVSPIELFVDSVEYQGSYWPIGDVFFDQNINVGSLGAASGSPGVTVTSGDDTFNLSQQRGDAQIVPAPTMGINAISKYFYVGHGGDQGSQREHRSRPRDTVRCLFNSHVPDVQFWDCRNRIHKTG